MNDLTPAEFEMLSWVVYAYARIIEAKLRSPISKREQWKLKKLSTELEELRSIAGKLGLKNPFHDKEILQ